ncbi:MAG: cation diffusion facilitator family transporter [Thermoguttaceae bacterium]
MSDPSHADIHALPEEALREKRVVALSSLVAALALTAMKLVVGISTNSLGVLSEAAHSALDLVAAAITFWAVRVSGKPTDARHTYGHGKFENLSALVETLLLLVTCVWIVYEATGRLFFGGNEKVDANFWAFAVILVSIAVDVSRSRALLKVARKHNSQALEADALHFSTDVWSSCVVILGLVGVRLAEWGWTWMEHADSAAALGVALIVIGVSFRLGRKSVADLLDAVPEGLRRDVETAVGAVDGVQRVKRLRLRQSGADYFADLTVAVDHAAPFARTHEIADRIESRIRQILPKADVVVHLEPEALDGEPLQTTIRVLAARHGLGAHGIRIYQDADQLAVELHLEVADSLNLTQAHDQVTDFERQLRGSVAGLERIVTHIEPAGTQAGKQPVVPAGKREVEAVLLNFGCRQSPPVAVHDVTVQQTGGELAVSCHCILDPATTITEAHELTERMEIDLRWRVGHVGSVVIHVEPPHAA